MLLHELACARRIAAAHRFKNGPVVPPIRNGARAESDHRPRRPHAGLAQQVAEGVDQLQHHRVVAAHTQQAVKLQIVDDEFPHQTLRVRRDSVEQWTQSVHLAELALHSRQLGFRGPLRRQACDFGLQRPPHFDQVRAATIAAGNSQTQRFTEHARMGRSDARAATLT